MNLLLLLLFGSLALGLASRIPERHLVPLALALAGVVGGLFYLNGIGR